jgi:integrase/recombinase XerD
MPSRCARSSSWCEVRGLTLNTLRTHHVASYVESLGKRYSAPTVKQHLAAVRMLFDWLVVRQVVEMNPAAAVRGPRYVVKKGKTLVLTNDEARQLLESIDVSTPVGLRVGR